MSNGERKYPPLPGFGWEFPDITKWDWQWPWEKRPEDIPGTRAERYPQPVSTAPPTREGMAPTGWDIPTYFWGGMPGPVVGGKAYVEAETERRREQQVRPQLIRQLEQYAEGLGELLTTVRPLWEQMSLAELEETFELYRQDWEQRVLRPAQRQGLPTTQVLPEGYGPQEYPLTERPGFQQLWESPYISEGARASIGPRLTSGQPGGQAIAWQELHYAQRVGQALEAREVAKAFPEEWEAYQQNPVAVGLRKWSRQPQIEIGSQWAQTPEYKALKQQLAMRPALAEAQWQAQQEAEAEWERMRRAETGATRGRWEIPRQW